MAQALYRKYRSKSLDEVVGQKHVTDILSRAIKQGRISHAYLLTGPRGVGKTSIARILAHEINELPYNDESNHLDIIEIDAASNNGVEDVRDLREKVQIAPASAKKKVYIIDEVHMLSKAAFNALLKTLEEPPEHVVFILATTDADKLPATIISRTQQFAFRSITPKDATDHLRTIANSEKIIISDDALALIAEHGEGSFRDSISLLDQLVGLIDGANGITLDLIENMLGRAPAVLIHDLLHAVDSHDPKKVVRLIDAMQQTGTSSSVTTKQLIGAVRATITEKPERIDLLDHLLDVSKSSHPDIKLLTVLLTAAEPKHATTNAALVAPLLEVHASIAELEKQAVRQKPSEKTIRPAIPSEKSNAPTESAVKHAASLATTAFDWDSLISYAKQHHVAMYSVLSKCAYKLDGNTLTLYTGGAFYKKKLDDAKYSALLSKSIDALGMGELDIHTIPTAPPPRDGQAAAIAVMMGGGEEVILEDGN